MKLLPKAKIDQIGRALTEHFPFTLFGAALGILLLGLFQVLFAEGGMLPGRLLYQDFFHIFHGFHLLFSAVASTAVYYRYHADWKRASIVGLLATLLPCSLSDIGIPYLGGFFLGTRLEFHWCLIEEPGLVFPFLVIGILGGLVGMKNLNSTTHLSHATHVMISSFASTFYFVSFGIVDWPPLIGGIFTITVFSVILPCCLSDIVLPISATPPSHSH